MTNELDTLKAKIDQDGRGQHGPSTIDVDRAFAIYDEKLEQFQVRQNEIVFWLGEFVKFHDDLTCLQTIERRTSIVATARDILAKLNPTETAPKPSFDHEFDRQGDEYFCTKCHKRWGFEEEPPECVS